MLIAPDPTSYSPQYDVCVIGSGPAGLAVALECERQGLAVVVLEAGSKKPSRDQPSFAATIMDDERHAPLQVGARQSLGGTSGSWGGLCVAPDGIDFVKRPYVAESGWPIDYDELADWEAPAAAFLGCGEPRFRLDTPRSLSE